MTKRFARAAMDADRRLTFEGISLDLATEQLVSDGEAVALTRRHSRPVDGGDARYAHPGVTRIAMEVLS